MNRTILLKTVFALIVSAFLCAMPEGAFARGGGHGGGGFGGGGFHGGGFSGGGFHGGGTAGFHGGNFGGFYGRGFGGFRGPGFYGWRGGWGYPGFGWGGSWGWGWGLNIGFGFGPYWGWGYPYYGYSPWWGGYAYSSPYSYPDPSNSAGPPPDACDYRYSDHCAVDPMNDDHRSGDPRNSRPSGQTPPAQPSNSSALQNSPVQDYRSAAEDYRVTAHAQSAPAKYDTVNYSFAELTTLQPSAQMRPAVRNVWCRHYGPCRRQRANGRWSRVATRISPPRKNSFCKRCCKRNENNRSYARCFVSFNNVLIPRPGIYSASETARSGPRSARQSLFVSR